MTGRPNTRLSRKEFFHLGRHQTCVESRRGDTNGQGAGVTGLAIQKTNTTILNQILAGGFLPCDPGGFSRPSSPDWPRSRRSATTNKAVTFQIYRRGALKQNTISTCTIRMMSRAPSTSGSNWTWALLVARVTEAPRIPLVAASVDSMLWTHDAHVMPVICR